MKQVLLSLWLFCTLFSFNTAAIEAPILDLGRTLFQSAALGSSGKSCSSCHPQGKGLEDVKGWETSLLIEQINECIQEAIKGEPLGLDSTEMTSLVLYLQSF